MNPKLFLWNVRGINDPDKHQPFVQWLNTAQPLFGTILETHIKEPNLNQIMHKVCRGWNFTSNHNSDPDGRIILIWKYPSSLRVLHQSRQSITSEISIAGGGRFIFTAVYASNIRQERVNLWQELIDTYSSLGLDNEPWVMGGDFNQITHPDEHSSPSVDHLDNSMLELSHCFNNLGVFDLRFQGCFHTWFNKRPEDPITKKLDRLLVNNKWLADYPHSQAFFTAPEFSDHSPCSVNLAVPLPGSGTKPFKFFNFLTSHPFLG